MSVGERRHGGVYGFFVPFPFGARSTCAIRTGLVDMIPIMTFLGGRGGEGA